MDFLMIENGDGGEIDTLPDGDIIIDGTYYTAVYLTLFCGNCFYKQLDMESAEENVSIEVELCKPSTQDNLKNLANIINYKLNWMIEQELAKNIEVNASAGQSSIIHIDIIITQPDGKSERFGIIWDKEKSELKRFGEIYGRV